MNWGNPNPWLLLLILIVPVTRWYAHRRRCLLLAQLADPELHPVLVSDLATRKSRAISNVLGSSLILLLLVLAAFRPQWGFEWSDRARKGVDIAVAVDVSESMLAQDVQPSRLQRAKREIEDLLHSLQGDRLALVAFAGVAFRESPLTLDYGTSKLFLSTLGPDLIPVAGTNIELAVNESIKALSENGEDAKSSRSKAIILITDGESFDGNLTSVREHCEKLGISLFILGVGTPEGGPIPSGKGFKKDKHGNVVITRLNETNLISLAKETGGMYVQSIASGGDTVTLYRKGIKKALEDTMFSGQKARIWHEYFQLPLFLAIALLITRALFKIVRSSGASAAKKKSQSMMGVSLLRHSGERNADSLSASISAPRGSAPIFLLFVISSFGYCYSSFYGSTVAAAHAESAEVNAAEGKELAESGKYPEALEKFLKAKKAEPTDFRYALGAGSAYYRQGKFEEALGEFFEAATKADAPKDKAESLYNTGNALAQLKRYDDAIKSYEDSLRYVPEDKDAQENLAYVKLLLEQQKKQDEDKKNQDDKKDQKGEKDKNDKESKKGDQKDKSDQEQKDQKSEEEKSQGQNAEEQKSEEQKAEEDKSQQEQQNTGSAENEESNKEEGKEQNQPSAQPQSQNKDDEKKSRSAQADESEKDEKEKEKDDPQQATSKDQQEDQQKDEKAGQAAEQAKGEQSQEQKSQALSSLDGVQENRGAYAEYRKQKAMSLLKNLKVKLPEKDW